MSFFSAMETISWLRYPSWSLLSISNSLGMKRRSENGDLIYGSFSHSEYTLLWPIRWIPSYWEDISIPANGFEIDLEFLKLFLSIVFIRFTNGLIRGRLFPNGLNSFRELTSFFPDGITRFVQWFLSSFVSLSMILQWSNHLEASHLSPCV